MTSFSHTAGNGGSVAATVFEVPGEKSGATSGGGAMLRVSLIAVQPTLAASVPPSICDRYGRLRV